MTAPNLSPNLLQEPLEDSAPLAHRLALRLCGAAPNGGTCVWSHGLWQYLRLFGLITTPDRQARFYAGVLAAAAAASGGARVLISGAADYGMLAQVLRAFRAAGGTPEVTVLDACETPLELCRWYAAREGLVIRTHRCNILDYAIAERDSAGAGRDSAGAGRDSAGAGRDSAGAGRDSNAAERGSTAAERDPAAVERFDIVCTHSFLGQFDAQDRARLVSKWFDLLKPGGRVATVNRIRPGRAGAYVRFTDEQAALFLQEVEERVGRAVLPADVDAAVLRDMARGYAEKFGAWAVESEADIRTLFEDVGFRVDAIDCDPVGPLESGRISGPSTPGGAQYANILATRTT